ncbi:MULTISPECIES: ScyD/ScyE family protein [unclassified Geodermatophilus]|uniref:ScyD/ScyE family protein n=1 Tax=unclassified Geodermatophilus TaxID=2637632 RepID=UPI003EE88B80
MRRTAVGVTAFALVTAPAAVAQAAGEEHPGDGGIATVATGLSGPRQLNQYEDGALIVAESDSGEVSSVDPWTGEVETLVDGLVNPQGVAYRDGLIYIAVGEAGPPEEGVALPAEPPEVGEGGPGLIVADTDGDILHRVDTLAYELENNPDGQVQFVDGAPVDSLSNPFSVLAQDDRLLVADAGANTVLAIDRHDGEISEFFVPPVVDDVPGCEGAENNPGTTGCDPVPTGVVEGPDGLIYVSTLGAEVPGASRVFVLTPWGEVVDVIEDLHGAAGVEVDRHGTVYVSELLEGAPEGEGPPPADFDPAAVGQVVRIDEDGRTYAQVTMPTGLVRSDGELYASAWSVAGLLMLDHPGEVVRIGDDAFTD